MLKELIAEVFERTGRTWKTTNGPITPDAGDVEIVLDEAARMLYDRPVGDRLETGGLIIEKREHGHDVYVLLGKYN